jgi:hypothetical protein
MAMAIAETASRNNVGCYIPTAILARLKMFSRALKLLRLIGADLVPNGEFCRVFFPHRKGAIETATVLTVESGHTNF